MTPRVTNPGAPTRALRTRGDSFEKEIVSSRETHAQNGHKKSVEKARTATTSPSTDKDSVLGKEKTFLSSMEHSLEGTVQCLGEHFKATLQQVHVYNKLGCLDHSRLIV